MMVNMVLEFTISPSSHLSSASRTASSTSAMDAALDAESESEPGAACFALAPPAPLWRFCRPDAAFFAAFRLCQGLSKLFTSRGALSLSLSLEADCGSSLPEEALDPFFRGIAFRPPVALLLSPSLWPPSLPASPLSLTRPFGPAGALPFTPASPPGLTPALGPLVGPLPGVPGLSQLVDRGGLPFLSSACFTPFWLWPCATSCRPSGFACAEAPSFVSGFASCATVCGCTSGRAPLGASCLTSCCTSCLSSCSASTSTSTSMSMSTSTTGPFPWRLS
mmetsp:Transcript_19265/g.30800  ORF Transcript_19265/g.30800 Transcript_19265/m.30800 type:complete len:278 (+) Transcript_19265:227-1060(+)